MGFSISWLAVRGRHKTEILRDFMLHETGETRNYPDGPVSAATLPDGSYLLFLNDCFHRFVTPEFLAEASRGCEVLGCQVEEHIMASAAFFWRNGKREWNVVHEANNGIYHLVVEGLPPEPFSAIRKAEIENQDAEGGEEAGVDYLFDIPVKLAAALSGFAHDHGPGSSIFAQLGEGLVS